MKYCKIILLQIIFVFSLFSQDATFVTSVDNTSPQIGESFSLSFNLSGGGIGGGKNFRPPDFGNFYILSGPNQSTSMQFVNGAVSSSVTFSYELQARTEGNFKINSATIEAGGKQFTTNVIEISVKKGSQKPAQTLPNTQNLSSENLFLMAHVDRSKVFVGEQITVVYKIYSRLRISNYSIKSFPSTKGFWIEEIPQNQQVQLKNEVVNGNQYQVGELKRIALFPTQSGVLEVQPFEITCQVQAPSRRRSNDPFDVFNDPFFNSMQTQNISVKSNSIKIQSVALPPNNEIKNFLGGVGKFDFNVSVSKKEAETNEGLTLKIKVSGTGNVKLIETPILNLSNEFELYPPKVSDNVNVNSMPISGTRTFEWLVIPRFPGNKKIPSHEFTYFNPSQNKYVTLTSSEIFLNIKQGSKVSSQPISGVSKEDIELLNQDIRFIKTGETYFTEVAENNFSIYYRLALYLAPFLISGGLIYLRIKNNKFKLDIVGYKSKRALKLAKNKLKEVEKLTFASDEILFYNELSSAITNYISSKLKIPFAQLTEAEIKNKLLEKNVKTENIEALILLNQNCELARFAPNKNINSEKKKLFDEAVIIISKLEEEIV